MTSRSNGDPSPYEWLEDGTSPQVTAWLAEQRQQCADLLAELPGRPRLRTELARLHRFETATAPVWRGRTEFSATRAAAGKRYLILRRDRGQHPGEPVVLFDSTAAGRGPGQVVAGWQVSRTGRTVAVELAERGHEAVRLLLVDTATGAERTLTVNGYQTGSLAWHGDDDFFLVRARDGRPELCRLDTREPDAQPITIEGVTTEPRRLSIAVSRDGRWLCVLHYAADGTVTLLTGPTSDAREGRLPATVHSRGSRILARFSSDNRLFHCSENDLAAGRVRIHDPARRSDRMLPLTLPPEEQLLGLVPLPGTGPGEALVARTGTATGVHLRYCRDDLTVRLTGDDRLYAVGAVTTDPLRPGHLWYTATSYDSPPAVHHIDLGTRPPAAGSRAGRRPGRVPAVEQVATEYTASDGVRIPLTLLGRPGLLDRPSPTILYVYGGFRISLVPRYMAAPNLWVAGGGTYAVAHVRGGGELGERWHRAGAGDGKAVSVADYLAAARWLIDRGVCHPGGLAGEGESNGGLVVASAIAKEPDLFAAALITSPVTDLLRFHLSGVGRNWLAEYGSPLDPADHDRLLRQSPLHNLRPGARYPAVLLSSWDGDRRVDPLHARKFCAALQAAGDGTRPTILHNVLAAGHGARTTADGESLAADRLAFAARWTGLDLTAATALPSEPAVH
ncbi:prolyl oligopeptidase family serine peptidase [Kitasatospora cineracea]|uniref:prolyl oligopeptidase family serine peptidase n=1 Tax=Kitasatospora cineracea TaxID=88074 RepID=UPI0038166323